MYGFSEDEQHLLFMDCFGLTRLSLPRSVKTDPKISGSESSGRVTVSRDGELAASYEDLWDKAVIWSFPEMRPAKRFGRFEQRGVIVHPAGTHSIICEHDQLKLEPLKKTVLLPLRLDAPADVHQLITGPVYASLDGGEQLSAVAFGGEGRPDVPVPLRIAHDGTTLYYDGSELICATLTGVDVKVHWRRAVTAPEGARLEFHADATRCVLMLHRGLRWTIVEREGTDERSFEIDSVGVPAVAGRWLAWQPQPDLVVRRNLETDEQTEHALSTKGPGTLFVGARGSLLFLTPDRETILDLIVGVEMSSRPGHRAEIPRELPAAERDVRQALLGLARPYVDAARLAGSCIDLGRVELNPKWDSVSITHRMAGGDNLFGALLAAHASSVWRSCKLPGRWRMGSYGSHGSIGYDSAVTLEQLAGGYTALAECGVSFASTIDFWSRQFESYGDPPREIACQALLAQALMAIVRDGLDAKLDFARLAKRGVAPIEEVIAAFENYPKRADQLDYNTTRFTCGLFNRLYGADAARLYTAVFLDAQNWQYYTATAYTDFCTYGIEPLLNAHPEVAEGFEAWFCSHEPVAGDRQHYFDQLRQRLGI
jgi:hypothetical protein